MERIPQPIMDKRGEPHMKRFEEQRWVLDNIVRSNGIDWDQPRSIYISGPCGPEGDGRHRRRPRAGQEDGRHRAGLRGGGAPPRGQGQGRRGGRQPGHRARQLFHGGGLLGRGAMALRPERRAERRLPHEEARELHQVRRDGRPQGRGRLDSVQGHRAAGLVPPAAELLRRQDPGGDLGARHGQLQGNPDRALRRPLSQPRLRRALDRRAGPVRVADAWHLFQHGELVRDRQSGLRLARQAARDRHGQGHGVGHELRHVLRHAAHRARAARFGLRGDLGVPRARLPHDLPGGVADLQEALHVHVRHHRRGGVRQDARRA